MPKKKKEQKKAKFLQKSNRGQNIYAFYTCVLYINAYLSTVYYMYSKVDNKLHFIAIDNVYTF